MNTPDRADAVERYLGHVEDSLRDADSGDLSAVEFVVDQLTELNRLLTTVKVPTAEHARTRSRLDRLMIGIGELCGSLRQDRDQVGTALAALNSRRGPFDLRDEDLARRRLDVSS